MCVSKYKIDFSSTPRWVIIFYEASGDADYLKRVLHTPELHTHGAWDLISQHISGFDGGGI